MAQPGFYLCGFNQSLEDYFPFASSLSPLFPTATPDTSDYRGLALSFQDFFDLVFQVKTLRLTATISDAFNTYSGTGTIQIFRDVSGLWPLDENEIGQYSCNQTSLVFDLDDGFGNLLSNGFTLKCYDYEFDSGTEIFTPSLFVAYGTASSDPSLIGGATQPGGVTVTFLGQTITMYEPAGAVFSGNLDVTIEDYWSYVA